MLIGTICLGFLVASATVTLAENSAKSHAKPAERPTVTKGVPLPPPAPRDVSLTVSLPSPELLEHQDEPDCEIPPSDRLLGAIPETTRLIYERQCYKNAETVVREKLQLLQEAIAGKALNDAGASRSLQPPAGGEQGAPARDIATTPKADASAKSSETSGNAGERSDAKSDPTEDQVVEPADQHRKPSAKPPVNLSAREGEAPKSPLSEGAHREKTHGAQTPNPPASGKPVMASAKTACQTSKPAGSGPRAWRLIEGRKCWYEGAVGMDKSLLRWPAIDTIPDIW